MAVFNQRFEALSSPQQLLNFASLVLVTLVVALVMTPAVSRRVISQIARRLARPPCMTPS